MTRGPWVSDEVWQSLDPRAGDLSRRARRTLWLLEAVLLVAVALVLAALASGLGKARVIVEPSSLQLRTDSHPAEATMHITNVGSTTATISQIGADHGVTVTSARGLPVHLKAHSQVTVTVQLSVTHCAAARQAPPQLTARVEQFWGHWSRTSDPFDSLLAPLVDQACATTP
jgi:hypothetical protein